MPEVLKKLEDSFFADLSVIHVGVWALAFVRQVVQVLLSKDLNLVFSVSALLVLSLLRKPSWIFSGETPVDSWRLLLMYDQNFFASELKSSLIMAYASIKQHFTFTNKIHIEMFNKFIIMITLHN